jgi:hypothetical protein
MSLNRDQVSMAKTRPPLPIPPLRPELEKFLYSSIGEPTGETPLSVLSALARQNVDPWEEAAHLAQLPRALAILRLTSVISSATRGQSAAAAPETVARLIGLLPQPDSINIRSCSLWPDETPRHLAPIITYLIVGAIIMASLLLGH